MELLEGIVAKLQTITEFQEALGVEALEEATTTPQAKLRTPSAYAILLGEDAGDNLYMTMGMEQRVTVTFGVVIVVENTLNPRGVTGGGYTSRLQEIRALVRTALLGYQSDPIYDPAWYLKGQLAQISQGSLWWQEEFQTAYYIRKFP